MVEHRVGPYKIIRPIGKGGMGRVYLALDEQKDQQVAIKVLPDNFLEDKKKSDYLRRELLIARELKHPNVVDIFNIIELPRKNDGKMQGFMLMEFIDGDNLRKHITDQDLSISQALDLCEQICAGLNYIHRHRLKDGRYHSIIHRDIKPENILINSRGQVKIVDFGLSTEEKGFRFLRSKSRAGTPQYMSPEQIRGKHVDERSDIYSLGVCMYELFTGKLPYEGKDRKEIMKMHISRSVKPEPASSINKKIPPALNRIIMTALQKNPDKRFPSVAELQLALKHVTVSRI
ncbi:MAG: serine/threonine protein kinase [Candidatus Abyssobacteria bacterium SURF_5]|jgi:serine/threonine-protein kinase|uniref:non-specific serine/threonine protein kinase n=1 Tax=Abyssobacteria bacterium (strain SURF_5) TaxID=2093360 RepID=A0A3A4NWC3_ABYX5|nr:MAG: serine/threonine protein kinase [Candidatus Abyssubacteria bacterium SURF_5]